MKLQNKKTLKVFDVEIRPVFYENIAMIKLKDIKTGAILAMYNSLAQLNKEWRDYEEPTKFWYICGFEVMPAVEGKFSTPDLAAFTREEIAKLEDIGNYFETEKEAEKAVEKLRAWTRLKDKGFRIKSYDFDWLLYAYKDGTPVVKVICDFDCKTEEDKKDLGILFGGEE